MKTRKTIKRNEIIAQLDIHVIDLVYREINNLKLTKSWYAIIELKRLLTLFMSCNIVRLNESTLMCYNNMYITHGGKQHVSFNTYKDLAEHIERIIVFNG